MLHARLFKEGPRYRDEHFQPKKSSLTSLGDSDEPAWLDGNKSQDRPLFVQFCANKPNDLLEAAKYVTPYCDAVDLNLGCPQGIARSGHYGAFLQEDWHTIHDMILNLHQNLSIPVTAKIRILETRERTLEYAKMVLSAGASILTVHGRRREQKGHNMGLADWSMIRHLRDNLPPDTVLFANGNILNSGDIQTCLDATGADGIMSADGNLSDPTIFATPPPDNTNREYWRGPDGRGGYRLDGVVRRYLDIIHRYVLEQEPPKRPPLYMPGDDLPSQPTQTLPSTQNLQSTSTSKKRKRDAAATSSPNLRVMQGHLFHLLRPMINIHIDIRDALSKCQAGDMAAFENVLAMLEYVIRKALDEEATKVESPSNSHSDKQSQGDTELTTAARTREKYKRPWWVCQPYIRSSPEEAVKKGALTLSNKAHAQTKAAIANEAAITLQKEELVCG
jgi:tRNA-dihydrouridine synthase 1